MTDTVCATELYIVDGALVATELPASRSSIPFADSAAVAVDLLRAGKTCRINASASVLEDVRSRLFGDGNGRRRFA